MSRRVESSENGPAPGPFRRSLQRWFAVHQRDLPWRRSRDPYAILVSEFMLQQTQVATVLPYYRRWLARFPDLAALARADQSEVLHAWAGLGYYARAHRLHRLAQFATEQLDGRLPAAAGELAQLPGIGRYTAGALASFAFDRPAPIVEVNIARLLARLTNWQDPIETAASRAHLWGTAEALLPMTGARDHNSALMDLGAMICLPHRPHCSACPVRKFCRAVEPALLPRKKQRPATVSLTERHAFTRRQNQILLEQSQVRWQGMWILPRLATRRRREPLLELNFPFTHHRVTLAVFASPAPKIAGQNQQWFPLRALDRLPVPSPHRRALRQLLPRPKTARS